MITIRHVTLDDAAAFMRLNLALDDETRFMMLEPGERTTTLDEQRQRIAGWLAAPNGTVFVAAPDDFPELAGYLAVIGGTYQRNRHSAHLVIGIRQAYSGQGIGTRLFEAALAWAPTVGLHRLELTVMTHNVAAVALYRKMGFQVEGTLAHTLCVEGRYVDEYSMARLLD